MEKEIKQEINIILTRVISNDPEVVINLETPSDLSHGDYTTNISFLLSKKLKKAPISIAENIAYQLQNSPFNSHFSKIEAIQPGFINFHLSKTYLLNHLERILSNANNIGKSEYLKNKKIIVEYSSPNIAKPFTIGHLRSTIIGDAIANILRSQGAIIYRDNHVGDWGTQFGKLIYAIKTWGIEEEIDKSDKPVKLLVQLYIKFHDEEEKNPELKEMGRMWFKKLEAGDLEAKRLWEKCINWSWSEFDTIYTQLNVHFTENNGKGYGESYFEDKMKPVIKQLKEKKLLTLSEGAEVVFFPNDEYPPLMIMKKDNTTLYSTRDLATDKFRLEKYGKDIIIINEIGAEQSLYMQQLFKTEEMLGWFKNSQRIHVKHGMYRFKDQKMSTRKGNVIWLEDVLEEAKKRAYHLYNDSLKNSKDNKIDKPLTQIKLDNEAQKITRDVAIGAIKYNDLKKSAHLDITFDWKEILNMEGNSGPYIQYTYARTQSILHNSSLKKKSNSNKESKNVSKSITTLSLTTEEITLLRLIYQFNQVIKNSATSLSPSIICIYLYNLAKCFNLFYQKHHVLNAKGSQKVFRLELCEATGLVLARGLNLLGIAAPSKM